MFRFLRGILFWFTFVTVTITLFLWLLFWVGYHRFFDKDKLSISAHAVAIRWGRWIMALTPGWHYSISGTEHLPQAGKPPVVMVANHQSAADIWALYLTGVQFRWLSKDAVFKVPLIGRAMHWAGYVPIKRGSRGSHSAALRASADWLRRGISMVFFPEGTRSEDGQLREFKEGAFRLAVEEKVDVLPIVIRGTRHMVQKKGAAPAPAHLELQVLPRVPAHAGESFEAFAKRVQQIIAEQLARKNSGPLVAEKWMNAEKAPSQEPF